MCGRIVVSLPILAAAGMLVGVAAGIVCPLAQQLKADTPSAQEVQATLFVATNGNDAWSGKLPAPNPEETDGPLATLRRARDVLRKLKASQTAPLVVMVRGGKYPLRETLVLGKQDSGTGEYPVTYRAYPGEKPLLSGGRRLTGWKPYREKILQCDLPPTEGGDWKFRQLFLGGHRQTRARHPDTGQLTVAGGPEEPSHSTFLYEAGSFPRRWARPTQGEVFMVMHWGYTNLAPIQKIDAERRTITSLHAVKDFTREPWGPVAETHFGNPKRGPYRFHVENLLEELDRPGEWCLDTEEGRVYFWPPDGSIDEREVVAPRLDCLIRLRGARWITIDGFTLTETTNAGSNMHYKGYEGAGAMFPIEERAYCGEAIHLKGARHCRISNNHFRAVGGNAIYLEGYNLKNVIQGNEIGFAGHCGVGVLGKREEEGEAVLHRPMSNDIIDNHIHHSGVFNKVAVGVFCGVSDGTWIAHNLIEEMPHHGINLGASGYGRNIVEYNRIRHCCLETYDTAAVNCWMEDDDVKKDNLRSGHVFRYNVIADNGGSTGFSHGLYIDNYASNCFVYGNLILRSGSASAIWINGGKNNLIENNILAENVGVDLHLNNHPLFYWPDMVGFLSANRFCRNIIYGSAEDSKPLISIKANFPVEEKEMPNAIGKSDYNLFFNSAGGPYVLATPTRKCAFEEWQKMGYDEHSRIADPLFVDPEQDDYRLKPGSPALELGFQAIDFTRVGPRPSKGR